MKDPPKGDKCRAVLQTDLASLRYCTAGAHALRIITSKLHCGAKRFYKTHAQGRPPKLNWRKKVRGWEFLHLLKFPCPRRLFVNPKIFNLPFLKILCFNHFPIFSFWKKSPKVFFPQSCLVSVSRLDKYIIRIFDLYASLF